eukprot:11179483-Lingulodinium_polyedra.AAC.1
MRTQCETSVSNAYVRQQRMLQHAHFETRSALRKLQQTAAPRLAPRTPAPLRARSDSKLFPHAFARVASCAR